MQVRDRRARLLSWRLARVGVFRRVGTVRLVVPARSRMGSVGDSRRFGVLLAGLFAVGVLSACGGGSESERTAMSLDEYVAACGAPTTIDLAAEFDLEAFSAAAAAQIGVLESIEPPEEAAGWHDAMLAYLRALQDTLDDAPDEEGSDLDEFLFSAVFLLAFEHGPALEDARDTMAPEVQERLRAAGCLGDGDASSPDFGVPPPLGPPSPSNVTYALEGSAIRLSWESVAEADHYNVYHDFLGSSCWLGADGSPHACTQLAGNVSDTTFLHTDPTRDNYYWVVACNRGGCSEIDSRNPTTVLRSGTAPAATAEADSAPADIEPAPPTAPDGSSDDEPDAPTAPAVVHECPATWADSPTLTVAELLTACGGDAAALAARTAQECAAEDISDAGDRGRTNAEQSRQHAADVREWAAEAANDGDEDLAEHYQDLAQHYEDLAQHYLDLALDAEKREMERRDRVMASRGATTWEQACEIMVYRVWEADYTLATSLGRAFLTHLAILGDVICGGPGIDRTDLCGGINLLNVLDSSIDALAEGIESGVGIIEGATDFFFGGVPRGGGLWG